MFGGVGWRRVQRRTRGRTRQLALVFSTSLVALVTFAPSANPAPPSFQNDILATGLNLPTSMLFLPDGRMLVSELPGTIKVLSPPYTSVSPTPFLQLTNVGNVGYAGLQQGIFSIALDPNFATNHYYYVFYTMRTPNRDRLSRFTTDITFTTTNLNTETVLYQDPQDANTEHHGGAIVFGNDGKLYFTTGDHFQGSPSQDLTSPRGKIHRINLDGTAPTDNPFYDGNGPHVDSIWALGLRNPYRAYFDAPTNRLFVGDVGGNNPATAKEEVNVGAAGANYGWPNTEGPCNSPCKSPLYWYAHNGRDASVTGGFVYHGTMFPSSYQGSYFFGDYAQNWIKGLTLDAAGNLNSVFNFEPSDGSPDGPYGDIVHLTEGPDGALYYIDLGYSDTSSTFGVSKIRRISYSSGNQPPLAVASGNPTAGPAPLAVSFSSAGSSDPEGQALTYAWTFGDGGTSTAANPSHAYAQAGQYSARVSVSDGVSTTFSTPISISVGNPPTATILVPTDGAFFRAADVISFSGSATDPEDGTLPASAYTWTIDFLHAGHVHPGASQTGVKSGTFTIPTSGHDFSGNTRYRVALTVTDSSGLTDTRSVLVYPDKVNLSFSTVPAGLNVYLDGVAMTTPFVYDTLIGFNHTISAPNQSLGGTPYVFSSWSDAGTQTHTITVPTTAATYTASFTLGTGIVFRSASSGVNGVASSLVLPRPVGVAFGDVLVAVVDVIGAPVVTAPAGWTLVRSDVGGTGVTSLGQAVYIHVAGLSEPLMWTWTFATAHGASGGILAYSGVDTVSPVMASSGQVAATGTAVTAPSVTTTAANSMLVGFFGMSGQRTMTPPAGMTERLEQALANPPGEKVTSEAADGLEPAVGASGPKTAIANSSGRSAAQLIVLRFGGGGGQPGGSPPVIDSVAINQTNPQTGDVLSATISSHDPDGDPVTYSYQWIKNGIAIPGANASTLDLAISGNGDRGEQIALRVTGSDGSLTSPAVTSGTVTVVNSPPTATVSLSDATPATDDTLVATATTSDADGDAVTLTYTWKVNGTVKQTTTTSNPTDALGLSVSGNGDAGDTITVDVTPNDGIANGNIATAAATVRAAPTGIVFRSASSGVNGVASSLVLPRPVGVAFGDVLVAVVDVIGAPVVTAPAGWTLVRSDVGGTGVTSLGQAVYIHVAGLSEPLMWTWTFATAHGASGGILAYSGVDTVSPVMASSGQVAATGTAVTAPSVTTTAANSMLVGFFGMNGQRTITPPAGMAEHFDQALANPPGEKVTSEAADSLQAATGASGSKTATANSPGRSVAQLIALQPAP